jgi:hypothetical protein
LNDSPLFFAIRNRHLYFVRALLLARMETQSLSRVELVCAGIYGLLLEWATIKQLQAYSYGQFLIMFDGAPLVIALAWACIIYTSMEFSDRIKLPEPVRPALDALLGLNIDLALDAIAIRLGMWTWGVIGINDQWFGVPWGNFWAWFIVIAAYSSFIRLLRRWRGRRVLEWLYAPAAVGLSLVVLLFTNRLFTNVIRYIGDGLIGPVVLIGGGLLLIALSRPKVEKAGAPDWLVLAVPMVNHVLMMIAGIIYGFYAQQPMLAVIGVVMIAIGLVVHLAPWWVGRTKLKTESQRVAGD